jgi:hypothetical protein
VYNSTIFSTILYLIRIIPSQPHSVQTIGGKVNSDLYSGERVGNDFPLARKSMMKIEMKDDARRMEKIVVEWNEQDISR